MSRPPTPKDKFLKELVGDNKYMLRAMRQLFDQAGTISPDLIEEAINAAGIANNSANQANATLEEIRDVLELLAKAPLHEHVEQSDDLSPRQEFISFSIELFQARKVTSQASTTSWADVTDWSSGSSYDTWGGSWGTTWGSSWTVAGQGAVDIEDSIYSFNTVTGVLTINDTGWFEIDAHYLSEQTGNSRVQGELKLVDSSGDVTVDKQYVSRDTTQKEGSAQISGYLYEVATSGETLKLQIQHVGAANDLTDARFTVKKVKDSS